MLWPRNRRGLTKVEESKIDLTVILCRLVTDFGRCAVLLDAEQQSSDDMPFNFSSKYHISSGGESARNHS
jgi:hypothetical protein